MTVPSDVSRSGPYLGNGVTKVFPYDFQIFSAGDLLVTKADTSGIETELTINIDYTVDGVLDANGGDVTLVTALPAGYLLSISRQMAATQPVDLRNQGRISAEILERAYDRLTMLIQQANALAERGLRLPETETSIPFLTTLPPLADRKGKQLSFDPITGQPSLSSPTGSVVSAAMQAIVEAATRDNAADAFTFSAAGSLDQRSLRERFADVINVKDFGAIGDGVTDDTAAIQAALDVGTADHPVGVFIPNGTFLVTNLSIGKGVNIHGSRGATLKLLNNPAHTAHPFFTMGLQRDTYISRVYYAINDVVPGTTITLSSPSDASHFSVGQYVVLVSTGYVTSGGSDRQPFYALINKITAVNAGTGQITLQSPILDHMAGMQIAKEGDFVPGYTGSPDLWACESSISGITIDATSVVTSQGIHCNGSYRCDFGNLHIIGATHGIAINGQNYSHWHDIIWTDMRVYSADHKIFEIKTGSYGSLFERLQFHVSATAQVTRTPIEYGEYASRCTMRNFRVFAPGVGYNVQFLVGMSGSMGDYCEISGGFFACAEAQTGVSLNGQSFASRPNVIGVVIRDIVIDCPACARTVRIVEGHSACTLNDFVIDGVVALQPPATPSFWSTTPAAMYVDTISNTKGVRISRVYCDGPLLWLLNNPLSYYTLPGIKITDCVVRNISIAGVDQEYKTQPWQIGMRRIRRLSDAHLSKDIHEIGSQAGVFTTGTYTVISTTFDLTDPNTWCNGDEIDIDISGSLHGVGGNKQVYLEINGSTYVTVSTSAQVCWTISGKIGLWGNPLTHSATGIISCMVSGSNPSIGRLQTASQTALTIAVKTNIAVSGDEVRIIRRRISPVLAYEG